MTSVVKQVCASQMLLRYAGAAPPPVNSPQPVSYVNVTTTLYLSVSICIYP